MKPLRSLSGQYLIQVNEVKEYYRRIKIRKLIIYSSLTAISAITSTIGWHLMKTDERIYTWFLFLFSLVFALWFAREFAYALLKPQAGKIAELNRLHREYQSQRMTTRDGEITEHKDALIQHKSELTQHESKLTQHVDEFAQRILDLTD